MHVLDILSRDRVALSGGSCYVRTKAEALHTLADLLARGDASLSAAEIEDVLVKREELQSTGVGSGVAIPHASMDRLERIVGALLVCREPIDFAAIDGEPVSILFAVVGPKRSTGEHLKTLARVSRLLRDDGFRQRLAESDKPDDALRLIGGEEGRSA